MLSVVVVAHGHQAWLRACLRSVLDGPRAGASADRLEVVVVDDASPDHSPRIAAEVAANDPRVRVETLQRRAGYVAARQAGLQAAKGDHVWFMSASDLLAPGAVDAVLAALPSGADTPDVLVVGEVTRDLYGAEKAARDGADRAALQTLVVRRELAHQVRPPDPGRFGDVAWAAALLSVSTSTRRLDQALYVRRLLPEPVLRRLADGDAFDVFAGYDAAFAALSAASGPGERRQASRRALADQMLRAQQQLLDRLPPGRRQQFFHRMARSYDAHRADLPTPRGRRARLEHQAISADRYQAYAALRRTERLEPRRRARRLVRSLPRNRRKARMLAHRGYYAAQRRLPLDPHLAVFTAYWGGAYSCNPRAVYEKARELAPWLRGVWVVKPGSEHVLPPGVEHVVLGTSEYYRLMARATYFVNNANFANDIVKRPGQVHLQTHHGTPLKTMGLDLVGNRHSSMGLNFRWLMQRVARWDYSISANEFSTEVWERVYPSGTYESLETGYPRNDVLANATAEHRERVRHELGVVPGQKAVLYTPTHREYTKKYVALLDADALARDLGPDFVILLRTHYFYGPDGDASAHPGVVDVADHPSIEDLCIASDVLVTDYSSVMFDYAVLDRPVVVYAPDWDQYRTERGVYFDLMTESPGAVTATQEELTTVLARDLGDDPASASLRAAFRAKYCSLEDGHAAERVVRRLWPDPAGPTH